MIPLRAAVCPSCCCLPVGVSVVRGAVGGRGSIRRAVRRWCAACGDGRSECLVAGLNLLMNEWTPRG